MEIPRQRENSSESNMDLEENQHLQATIQELEVKIKQLDESLAREREESSKLKKLSIQMLQEIKMYKDKLQEQQLRHTKELSQLHYTIQQLQQTLQKNQKLMSESEQREEALKKQIAELKEKSKRFMKMKHADLQKQFEEYQESLQEELILARRRYEERREKLAKFIIQLQNGEEGKQLRIEQQRNKELEIRNNVLCGQIQQLERQNNESMSEIQKLRRQLEQLQNKVSKDIVDKMDYLEIKQ